MVEIEPQFSLNQIRFIFADRLITQEIIVQLGVEEICVLHDDPYHLLNKVFPENFGLMYDSLFRFLNTLLMGKEEEVEKAFEASKQFFLPHPHKLSTLVHIHSNTSYYTKWCLLTMEGNFVFGGSVSAEQNYASVAAHLVKGVNFCISKHIKLLADQQMHIAKVCQTDEYKLLSMINQFK